MAKRVKANGETYAISDSSITKSSIAIGPRAQASYSAVESSSIESDELEQALKALTEAVMASQQIPDSKKKEQVELIKLLNAQATKPEPNKSLIRSLGDLLMDGLKAIPEVASSVIAVTSLLAKLFPL